MANWLACCLSYCFTFCFGLAMLSTCCLGARGGPARPICLSSALADNWMAGSLNNWFGRSLAGWSNDGEADWRTGWLSSWSGNGLEVLSGRAGPRPAGAAPRAHACGAAVLLPGGQANVLALN